MGMFDEIKCSYNIGQLTDQQCQTKDLHNLFSFFWIDPTGQLWYPNYAGTYDISIHDSKLKARRNGVKGRLEPQYHTGYITIYESNVEADGFTNWIECRLTLVSGKVQDFSYINNYTKK